MKVLWVQGRCRGRRWKVSGGYGKGEDTKRSITRCVALTKRSVRSGSFE